MNTVKTVGETLQYKISTRLLMQEALRKGYAITHFPSSPSTKSGITRCVKNGKELFFRSTSTALTPSYGVFAAENKALTYSMLVAHDINTPVTEVLSIDDSIGKIEYMLETFGRVVVKPVDTNHGDGITVGVASKDALARALVFARAAVNKEPDVLVQQQIEGQEYRFLVISGKVIAVASRRPPFVVGDGKTTVLGLINIKNQDPRRGDGHSSELTVIDVEDVKHHKGEGFLGRIPGAGEKLQLLETSNLSRGGEAIDCTDVASPSLKKLAVAAAGACFTGIAGVDIITKDIKSDTTDDSYVIEVNLAPGIRMHQFPSEGEPRDVAKIIFSAIEKTAQPAGKAMKYVGRAELIGLTELSATKVPARIDTGATLSSIWASQVEEVKEGLSFVLYDISSKYYTGQKITVPEYSRRVVSSSMGHTEVRYQIKTIIQIRGRKIRAHVTLADRSTQVYPVLIGRSVLKNKFIVDVAQGKVLAGRERLKRAELDAMIDEES